MLTDHPFTLLEAGAAYLGEEKKAGAASARKAQGMLAAIMMLGLAAIFFFFAIKKPNFLRYNRKTHRNKTYGSVPPLFSSMGGNANGGNNGNNKKIIVERTRADRTDHLVPVGSIEKPTNITYKCLCVRAQKRIFFCTE